MFRKTMIAALTSLAMTAGSAQAVTITFDDLSTSTNTTATGSAATLDFSFVDVAPNVIQASLKITNTTGVNSFGSGATASNLVGVGFDIQGSLVGGSFSAGGALDTLLSNVSLSGSFSSVVTDIGIADDGNFQAGPSNGLTEGQMQISTFLLSSSLSAANYTTAFQQGYDDGSLNAIARFKSVNAGEGSDKLLYTSGNSDDPNEPPVSPVPLPAGAWLLLSGLGTLGVMRRRKKSAS